MKHFWLKFLSRKFLVALLGAILVVLGKTLSIPEEVISWIVKLLSVYIGGEAAADIARTLKGTKHDE